MDDASLAIEPDLLSGTESATDLPSQLIAPWWHTAAILLALAAWASLTGRRTHAYASSPHAATYISQVLVIWMLFGSVVAGIIDRSAFFFSTLRDRANSFWNDTIFGLVVYTGIYGMIIAMSIVVGAATIGYHHLRLHMPQQNQSTSQSNVPLPPLAPEAPHAANPFSDSPFHFNSKTVLALAPSTPSELLLWIGVSMTAGFCEEHIFRGYLLKQSIAAANRIGISPLFAKVLCILATSLIFGSLHLYEGIGGALLITFLGCVYSVVALKLGNLRAVIAAHFLQDFVAGTFLFLLHTRLAR